MSKTRTFEKKKKISHLHYNCSQMCPLNTRDSGGSCSEQSTVTNQECPFPSHHQHSCPGFLLPFCLVSCCILAAGTPSPPWLTELGRKGMAGDTSTAVQEAAIHPCPQFLKVHFLLFFTDIQQQTCANVTHKGPRFLSSKTVH